MASKRYKFARRTASVRMPGSKYPTMVHVNEPWHALHPVVAAHPDLFGDEPAEILPRGFVPPVEQATAAPGEKRSTRRSESTDES